MVMETPSPQCVGREFVRQYYTVLNKAPLFLHRFYSDNSSFLHGELDRQQQGVKPVVGQQEIHQKIMQLNFRDCHAKILQVDSHETLGNGVVVQVTGELSNNGQPMRRFVQTFVLAPQSPKKYYVHNDIFRYQDSDFNDEEEVDDNSADADVEDQSAATPTTDGVEEPEDNEPYYEEVDKTYRNGSVHPTEAVNDALSSNAPQTVSPEPEPESTPKSEWDEDEDEEEEDEDEEEEDEEEEEEEDEEEEEEEEEENTQTDNVSPSDEPLDQTLQPSSQPSSEPKTYANMVSKNPPAGFISNASVCPTAPTPVVSNSSSNNKQDSSEPLRKHDSWTVVGSSSSSSSPGGTTTYAQYSQPHRLPRPRIHSGRGMGRFDLRDSSGGRQDNSYNDGERRKPLSDYPDIQQLFIGNLTHSITEEDLKKHFAQYGTVLDMRINKQNQKMGGGKVPNFGFIVFDDPETVQKVLNEKPIHFNGHRLNVEEKKQKDTRMSIGDGRIGIGRGGMSGRGLGMRGRGSMGGSQGTGRGENRGRGGSGNYGPRR